ncbi:DUF2170 family protein [Desulfosediminicola sp.]|uniref:DUF2170 family protein n=1 Tax=Desulfosediminicola sp. TaxID=2886825 RepID=UPI003AF28B97
MSWSNEALAVLAEKQANWTVTREEKCICIKNSEGIDAFVYAGNRQLIAEIVLFAQEQVKDIAALNEMILRSHHMLPLTAVCLQDIAGESYYVAFGALSVDSKDAVVLEEIETLFDNVGEFLELYSQQLTNGVTE